MITRHDMRSLEESAGIPKLTLMENAGREAARIISEKAGAKGKRVLFICHHGNNGGDGFVAARHLSGISEVDVLFIGQESKLSPESMHNFELVEKDAKVQFISLDFVDFSDYGIIVDAILGTGARGEIGHPISTVIDNINSSSAFKVSLDIPTGIDPETGQSGFYAVEPDLIITFHDIKTGLEKYSGKTVIADIGIRKKLT
ncbi:NAD(P)H-hydrate epimerase [Candidatus Woesearchaeota archaeon]|nr:NAD(P)H-hydrate epimerase [Candidatus Woesearchaeota archaeon]